MDRVSGKILPVSADFAIAVQDEWPMYRDNASFPRSAWLHMVEAHLRELHPTANSDSLTLTARTLAPFPLQKPGVP